MPSSQNSSFCCCSTLQHHKRGKPGNKSHACLVMDWFNDDGSSVEEPAPAASALEDDEDPLDAYMKSLQQSTSTAASRQQDRLDLSDDEDEGTSDRSSSEKKKTVQDEPTVLPPPNHIGITSRNDPIAPRRRLRPTTNTPEGHNWRTQQQVTVSEDIDPMLDLNDLRDLLGPSLASLLLPYSALTTVQSQTLPVLLAGLDALVTAATGQGKTLAYLWPALVQWRQFSSSIVVLVPTRELAVQVHAQAKPWVQAMGCHSKVVVGGQEGRYKLLQDLRKMERMDLLVATPGRLLDLASDKKGISLGSTTIVVLDEADKLLQMGFEEQVTKILAMMPRHRQTCMLSATLGRRVEHVARQWLDANCVRISVGRTGRASENVEQHVMVLKDEETKTQFLLEMLPSWAGVGRTLVFVATRVSCETTASRIRQSVAHIAVETIHGDRHQSSRTEALRSFKAGRVPVLVATDVASRGLDIPSVSTVVCYDPAKNLDTHVHRVGRAGRLAKDGEQKRGTSYTLLTPRDHRFAQVLQRAFERENREVPSALVDLAHGRSRAPEGGGASYGGAPSKRFRSD